MRFAWQGFSFDLPSGIHPISLTGSFRSGYVGLASSEGPSVRIRWQHSKLPINQRVIETYLVRVAKDAKKSKKPPDTRIWQEGQDFRFKHTSGEGALLQRSGRIFFVEISASSNRTQNSAARQVLCSFQAEAGNLMPWHVLGLEVSLPRQLALQRKELVAGKTALHFTAPLAHVRAERWGAADQLLSNSTLASWLKALLNSKTAEQEDPTRACLTLLSPMKAPVHAKAVWQVEQNQITLVRSSSRQEKMRPQWDWFD